MKKWFKRIALGIFITFGLLYVFLMVRSLIPVTVQDQELQLKRVSIPQGSNAFDVLQAATNNLWWPKDGERQISDLTKDANWDAALAGTILASNREALAGWDAAVKLPDLQVPEISTAVDLQPYLSDWKKLAQLAEVREIVLLHNGQDKEAFDKILDHVQLGQQMQNAHGRLIDYFVGTAVRSMGLTQMQRWAGKTHLTPNQLKEFIRQLGLDSDAEGAVFANTIKAEYQFQIEMLDAMRQGKITNSDPSDFHPNPSRLLPLFNFSQTKALFAKEDLKLVKAAPHHYSEANIAEMELRPGLASMFFSGNPVGRILHSMIMPTMARSLEKKSQADAQLQATRTILALRAYQLTHGNLPPDLNALVPEFLDAVPVDDFDGRPLRYSAEKKIVYSVGRNLKDDGGDDRTSAADWSQRHLDLVYKFDF